MELAIVSRDCQYLTFRFDADMLRAVSLGDRKVNSRGWREAMGRRAERMAKIGLRLEDEVERILERMREERKIDFFRRTAHNSSEDSSGKDFVSGRYDGNTTIERPFGITCSLRRWREAKLRHRGTPQFCFPVGTKPETIERKILNLFNDTEDSSHEEDGHMITS